MAAAMGNQYAVKSKRWTMAIERALAKRSRVDQVEALDALAERLLALADEGELGALRELGDRLEGKPVQAVAVGQDPDADPVQMAVAVTFHDAKPIAG